MHARYKNVVIENGMKSCPNQCMQELQDCGHFDPNFMQFSKWCLIRISIFSKLDGVLEGFAIETSNDFKSKTFNDQLSQTETNIGSSSLVVVLRDDEELTIHDPLDPMAAKERPKNASKIKSEFEDFLS